jgi:signal transduction histidine kinase
MPETAQIVLQEMEPGLCLIDDGGRVSLHNRSARALLDCDLTDRDLMALDLDDQSSLVAEMVDRYRRQRETGGAFKGLLVFTRENRVRCLSLSIFPVEAGGVSATGILLNDVSDALTGAPGLNKILSQVRHDLRSPLTSIAGASELLMSGRMGTLAGNQIRLVKIIEEGARRLGELLEMRTQVSEESAKAVSGEIS